MTASPSEGEVLAALDRLADGKGERTSPTCASGFSAIDVRREIGTRGINWETTQAVLLDLVEEGRVVRVRLPGRRVPLYRLVGS